MYCLWPGIIGAKKPCTNISRAFKQIVKWAKDENISNVTIAEDDIIFTAPGAWNYYLENFPSEYDLYLGGVYHGTLQENKIINGYSGNTLITIHKNFYDFFLSADENNDIDRWLGNFAFERNYIVCLPFVCKQLTPNYSDHKRKLVKDYLAHEEGWKYFGLSTPC